MKINGRWDLAAGCWVLGAIAFTKNICSFQFVILDLSLKEIESSGSSSMANLKLQIENYKCFS
jgi:hypothetical protein